MRGDDWFDRSLPALAQLVREILGPEFLETGMFLRDATGRLAFLTPDPVATDAAEVLSVRARERLGPYVDPVLSVIATIDEIGAPAAANRALRPLVRLPDEQMSRRLKLIDRRIVGQDWTVGPTPGWQIDEPARFAFWSLKGGVGRTTALCVVAAQLARQGRRVLAIDLDLEAPGIGSLLLSADEYPIFGSLDWFVENGMHDPRTLPIEDFVGASSLAGGAGMLHVVPVHGRVSRESPENVIPKLGRAYLEDIHSDKGSESFLEQAQDLTDRALAEADYDLVLIDVRAGLNEATPAALLGLRADILMFGLNTPQTFEGYRSFLAYSAWFPIEERVHDWRLRLKMVQARAPASPQRRELFRDKAYDLFNEYLYERPEEPLPADAFSFGLDDPDAPHSPWVVLDDERFREFDALDIPQDHLTGEVTSATFGHLLEGLKGRMSL